MHHFFLGTHYEVMFPSIHYTNYILNVCLFWKGSPTKEAPSPTKEKKKKKKFRMPSFSKKKKDSKESAIWASLSATHVSFTILFWRVLLRDRCVFTLFIVHWACIQLSFWALLITFCIFSLAHVLHNLYLLFHGH